MRRLSFLLAAVAILANLAAWPAAALAESLEHQQEQAQLADPAGAPAEPESPHCHCSQHLQGQPAYAAIALRVRGVEQPLPVAHIPFSQPSLAPPFRPPLAAPTQS
jgi:hypothetical protein